MIFEARSFVPAVDQGDLGRELGEKRGLLDRGVAAAHHGEPLAAKEEPSQVAHVDTPWPSSRCSDSSPSMRAVAPVEMTTESPRYSAPSTQTPNGDAARSTRSASAVTNSAPNRAACSRNFVMSSGPKTPSGKPG